MGKNVVVQRLERIGMGHSERHNGDLRVPVRARLRPGSREAGKHRTCNRERERVRRVEHNRLRVRARGVDGEDMRRNSAARHTHILRLRDSRDVRLFAR